MKKIFLTMLIMAGFFMTANAQKLQTSASAPMERRFDRRMELRRFHRMECRRRHRRLASETYPVNAQKLQAVLYKAEEFIAG
jgi:hypothetical protein